MINESTVDFKYTRQNMGEAYEAGYSRAVWEEGPPYKTEALDFETLMRETYGDALPCEYYLHYWVPGSSDKISKNLGFCRTPQEASQKAIMWASHFETMFTRPEIVPV